jgi:autotransporter-associated beta strand protein
LVFAGNATLGAESGTGRTFSVNGAGQLGLNAVGNGTTATQLNKNGNGTLTLAGNNTYSGGTAVNGGTLLLLGGAQLSGAGAVVVGGIAGNAKAIFGGNGSVNGATTINATGTISPGLAAVAGELRFSGGLNFNAGATFLWELATNSTTLPGVNWDRISVTLGSLTVAPGTFLLPSFTGAATPPSLGDSFWQTGQSWENVLDLEGGGPLTGATFLIDNSPWASAGSFSTIAAANGSGIALQWTPVPEPSALVLLGLSAVTVGALRRRRHSH